MGSAETVSSSQFFIVDFSEKITSNSFSAFWVCHFELISDNSDEKEVNLLKHFRFEGESFVHLPLKLSAISGQESYGEGICGNSLNFCIFM